jgi:sugar fermentation stimulation protein A
MLRLPLPSPLVPAAFAARPHRFAVRARLGDGTLVEAHLADPGRMRELLVEGRTLLLHPNDDPRRKLRWSCILCRDEQDRGWVSLDTTLSNRLVELALAREALPELTGWRLVRREFPLGPSRFDFLLEDAAGHPLVLEVKSVSLRRGREALFPDAVTARGRRHLLELAARAREGEAAAVLFVVQRAGVTAVRAAQEIDPAFAAALEEARRAGVRFLARGCRVGRHAVTLGGALPVHG